MSVDYATSDGTAGAPGDYAATSGTLNFADGETTKTFDVPVNWDGLAEGDETISLALSNPANGADLGTQRRLGDPHHRRRRERPGAVQRRLLRRLGDGRSRDDHREPHPG